MSTETIQSPELAGSSDVVTGIVAPSGWRDRLPGLPEVLRFTGATILVAALSVFLFQRWGAGNDVFRYLTLLGLTVGLTGAGLFSGILLREGKGARVFLGLVLLTVPIHFTVLGALVYSQFSWEPIVFNYPQMATWRASSPIAALSALGGALLVLLPVIGFSAMTFVRSHAVALTAAMFGLGLPLLLPTRSLGVVTLLALGLVLAVLWLELRVWRRRAAMKTPEGRFVRGLLMLPFAMLLGRGLWLYDASSMLVAVAAGAVFGLLLLGAAHNRERPRLARLYAGLSLLPAAVAAWALVVSLRDAGWVAASFETSVMALPFIVAMLLVSRVVPGGGAGYRRVAALVAVFVALGELLLFGGVAHALIVLGVGVLTLSYGYLMQQKLLLTSGVLAAVIGLGFQVYHALEGFELGGWLTLAAIGTLAILSASLLERFGSRLVERLRQAREHLADWDY